MAPPNKLGESPSKVVPSILGAPPTKILTTVTQSTPNEKVMLGRPHGLQFFDKGKPAVVETISHSQSSNNEKGGDDRV